MEEARLVAISKFCDCRSSSSKVPRGKGYCPTSDFTYGNCCMGLCSPQRKDGICVAWLMIFMISVVFGASVAWRQSHQRLLLVISGINHDNSLTFTAPMALTDHPADGYRCVLVASLIHCLKEEEWRLHFVQKDSFWNFSRSLVRPTMPLYASRPQWISAMLQALSKRDGEDLLDFVTFLAFLLDVTSSFSNAILVPEHLQGQ